jgi:hypothetical protein
LFLALLFVAPAVALKTRRFRCRQRDLRKPRSAEEPQARRGCDGRPAARYRRAASGVAVYDLTVVFSRGGARIVAESGETLSR